MIISPIVRRINPTKFDLVLDGNSLVAYMSTYSSYSNLGAPGRSKQNFGVGAQHTLNMISDATTQIDTQVSANKILIAWEVRNDLYFGRTVSEALENIQVYCQGRRAAGYKIVLIGCLPTVINVSPGGQSNAQFGVTLAEANGRMRRDWQNFADAFVDISLIPGLSDPNDTTTYTDKIHLSDSGYALLYPEVNKAIARIRR
jgi:lysophospholipase L1-like esterase